MVQTKIEDHVHVHIASDPDRPNDTYDVVPPPVIVPVERKKRCDPCHHLIGIPILIGLLVFHILCFVVTISLAIGVGILSGALHEICWDAGLPPFWQVYITLVIVVIALEIYFRIGGETKLNVWVERLQQKYYLELFFVPRVLYFCGYVLAVAMLFFSYYGAHHNPNPRGPKSPFDGKGDAPPSLVSPMSMGPTDDHFHGTAIFFVSLCYMTYVMAKESDWATYRKAVMQTGDADPVTRGSIGSFVLYLTVHLFITFVYGLPLVGVVYLLRQFEAGAGATFFLGNLMAIFVGVAAIFVERRPPFPTEPLLGPAFAYENHLRIRVAILQFWLIPLAAGRYFNSNRADPLDAQNDDLLIFIVEVGMGVLQAVKIFGNDILVYMSTYRTPVEEPTETTPELNYDYFPGDSITSIVSVTKSTQTFEEGLVAPPAENFTPVPVKPTQLQLQVIRQAEREPPAGKRLNDSDILVLGSGTTPGPSSSTTQNGKPFVETDPLVPGNLMPSRRHPELTQSGNIKTNPHPNILPIQAQKQTRKSVA